MGTPRFQFYETVRVASDDPELAEIRGERGAILGMSEHDDGTFGYAVFIFRDEMCWDLAESELEATGVFGRREDFYDDPSVVRVRVDEQGRGWIAD